MGFPSVGRLSPRFLVIATLLATMAPSFSAHGLTCDRVFSDENLISRAQQDVLSSSSPKAQRFLDLLRNGLSRRYGQDPEVRQMVRDLSFMNLNESSQPYVADWVQLRTELSFSVKGDVMIINIPRAVVQTPGADLRLGERPKGLNTAFSKLLAGLVESIRAEAERNPNIKKVDMVAGHVVNLPLIELLKQSGFSVKAPMHPMTSHMDPMMGFGMGMGMDFGGGFALGRGPMNRFTPPRIHDAEVGRDWVLRFDVNR